MAFIDSFTVTEEAATPRGTKIVKFIYIEPDGGQYPIGPMEFPENHDVDAVRAQIQPAIENHVAQLEIENNIEEVLSE